MPQDPLRDFLSFSEQIGIPEAVMLNLLGAKTETLAAWKGSEDSVISQDTMDYIRLVLGLWADLQKLAKPEDAAQVEKIQKLLRLGGDRNPNSHERESALQMARDLMARHSLTEADLHQTPHRRRP